MGYSHGQVRRLFDRIAYRYDLLNGLLSIGLDRYWRNRMIRSCEGITEARILDIATGTGDVLSAANALGPQQRVGIDLSRQMLLRAGKKLGSTPVSLLEGIAESLPFQDQSFDLVLVAFGVRNFTSRPDGLQEMHRVLRRKGHVRILDFSDPQGVFRHLYKPYFRTLLPAVGGTISGSKDAYAYLPETVMAFPSPGEFAQELRTAGFDEVSWVSMSMGIVTLYSATKN